MKIKKLHLENVRGFLTKTVEFRDDITFLVGINGSGKTTVLELIKALLTPNIRILITIEFSKVQLECLDDKDKAFTVTCVKTDGILTFQYDKENSQIRDTVKYDRDLCIKDNSRISDYFGDPFEKVESTFSRKAVYRAIKALSSPIIVGLNRLNEDNKNMNDLPFNYMESHYDRTDDVTKSLEIVQNLLFDFTRKSAQKQNLVAKQFSNSVFEILLTVSDNMNIEHDYNFEKGMINEAKGWLSTIDTSLMPKSVVEKLEKYIIDYENAINNFEQIKTIDQEGIREAVFKVLMLGSQFEKFISIAAIAKANAEEITEIKRPLTGFVDSVNIFFKESGKKIYVLGDGSVVVNAGKNRRLQLKELSSGEKQIVILMAYLSLYLSGKNAKIYIIDEPELSLHIAWQELFVDALLKASPETQFILATHAPSIIAKNSRRNNCEDLTEISNDIN